MERVEETIPLHNIYKLRVKYKGKYRQTEPKKKNTLQLAAEICGPSTSSIARFY